MNIHNIRNYKQVQVEARKNLRKARRKQELSYKVIYGYGYCCESKADCTRELWLIEAKYYNFTSNLQVTLLVTYK